MIVGAGKAGTTTLAEWLDAQPGVLLSHPKEPRWFCRDDALDPAGLERYFQLFADATPDQLAGEASTAYTDPAGAGAVSARMHAALPDARLVYLVRHPIERLRSQYRYHVVQGRQDRPLLEAVRQPGNRYVGRSLYHTCLAPFLDRFGPDAVAVVRFEDLVASGGPGWTAVLDHLGLPRRDPPATAHNVTVDLRPRPIARPLRSRGLIGHLPAPVRGAARRGATRLHRRGADHPVLASAMDDLPDDVEATIWDDVARLEAVLGRGPLF